VVSNDPEAVKYFGATVAPILNDGIKVAVQETASLGRWVLATLVVINGGGIATTLPLTQIPLGWRVVASFVFVSGIVSVIAGASHAVLTASERIGGTLGKALGYYASIARSGVRDQKLEREIMGSAASLTNAPVVWLSLASLVCFVAGVAAVALGYWG